MVEYEVTNFEQASEDLLNKSREALKVLSLVAETLPKHTVDQLVALRDAVWEMEKWQE